MTITTNLNTTMRSSIPEGAVTSEPSLLQSLRALIPQRQTVSFSESLRIAEIQAARMLSRLGYEAVEDFPLPSEAVAGLPRIRVVHSDELPTFGCSFWDSRVQEWIIELSTRQSRTRRRFTLFHEYKHIIGHPARTRLYRGDKRRSSELQAELVADFFAGCALVPRRALKSAWGSGMQRPEQLAEHFDVSPAAVGMRLDQTGLRMALTRCGLDGASAPGQLEHATANRRWAPRTHQFSQPVWARSGARNS